MRTIHFYLRAFTPVSITGHNCEQHCKHCSGYYLKHMIPTTTNEELISICRLLKERGENGVVLSGGSRNDGTVGLEEFIPAIRTIKSELGMTINAHTGPLSKDSANKLVEAGLDCALVDVIGDKKTIEEILGFEYSPEDIRKSMRYLIDAGIPNIAPHIIAGLYHGKLEGEFQALSLLEGINPANIVIVVFIPTKETDMDGEKPPRVESVVCLVREAKRRFPEAMISLSCVRPGGPYRDELDVAVVEAGIDKIAVPSRAAIVRAEELGLKIVEHKENLCCAW